MHKFLQGFHTEPALQILLAPCTTPCAWFSRIGTDSVVFWQQKQRWRQQDSSGRDMQHRLFQSTITWCRSTSLLHWLECTNWPGRMGVFSVLNYCSRSSAHIYGHFLQLYYLLMCNMHAHKHPFLPRADLIFFWGFWHRMLFLYRLVKTTPAITDKKPAWYLRQNWRNFYVSVRKHACHRYRTCVMQFLVMNFVNISLDLFL